jgi:hypothetical protein
VFAIEGALSGHQLVIELGQRQPCRQYRMLDIIEAATPSMGFAPENEVRTGLPAGGSRIRTLGPPAKAELGAVSAAVYREISPAHPDCLCHT